jgi:hypothetical protein
MINSLPKYITEKAIALYLVLLLVTPILWGYPMEWYSWLFGMVEVIGFFYFSKVLSFQWSAYSVKYFERKLFTSAFVIRVIYVLFSYWFYTIMTGVPFEFEAADSGFYNGMGQYGATLIMNGDFHLYEKMDEYAGGLGLSDSGYPIYLSVIYALTGNSIIIARLLKALWSAWTVLLVYRVAYRNFEDSVARLAAIFCLLMPNLIFYCGLHLKEVEMLFITVLFIERADFLLRSEKFVFKQVLVLVLIGLVSFTFRSVLGVVLFLSFFTALVLSSAKVVTWGKRIIVGILAMGVVYVTFSDQMASDVEEVWNSKDTVQKTNMNWRSEREGGNSFAKYASAAVFAPLIFTIPFPTMVATPGQINQRLIHGGNFVKNITSFFTIMALFSLLFSGNWRKHVLLLSFLCGYLVVLVFSSFAQSERFHIPSVPFALMFAAYGISIVTKKQKKWFNGWLILIFVANIAWSWFKLRGRGM